MRHRIQDHDGNGVKRGRATVNGLAPRCIVLQEVANRRVSGRRKESS